MSGFTAQPDELQLATRQIQLQLQKVGASLAQTARLTVERREFPFDALVARLEAYVLAQHLVSDTYETTVEKLVSFDHTEQFPASWWQHFKLQHLPTVAKRWPVRYHDVEFMQDKRVTIPVEIRLDRWAAFPNANVAIDDSRLGAPVIWEQVTQR